MTITISYALTPEQQELIEKQPPRLQDRLKKRMDESLQATLRLQVEASAKLGINTQVLNRIIVSESKLMQEEDLEQEKIISLVKFGAGIAVLKSLGFKIDKKTFLKFKADSDIKATWHKLSVEVSSVLYRAWERHNKRTDADTLIKLYEETKVPINIMWSEIQEWRVLQGQFRNV